VKIANIEFGTSMVVNYTQVFHMITLLLALNGLPTEKSLLLVLSKCSVSAIRPVGHIALTNQLVDPCLLSHGPMMVPLLLQLVATALLLLAIL
jgi:hypothetical protein